MRALTPSSAGTATDHRLMAFTTRRIFVVLISSLFALMVISSLPASAQDSDGSDSGGSESGSSESGSEAPTSEILAVSSVDASGEQPVVAVFGVAADTAASAVTTESSAGDVKVARVEDSAAAGWPAEVVFVVDADNRTVSSGFEAAMSAIITEAMGDLPDGSRVALVSAGTSADIEVPLTANAARVRQAVAQLAAQRGASILDGVALAGKVLNESATGGSADVVRSVVVLADGPDTASEADAQSAGASLLQSGSKMVALSTGAAPKLELLATNTAGSFGMVDSSEQLPAAGASAVELAAHRLLVSLQTSVETEERFNVKLAVDGRQTSFSYPAGLVTSSAIQLEPIFETEPGALAFLGQPIFLYISIGLAFAGITLAIWVLGAMFIRGESALDRILSRYADGDELADEEVQEMLVETALLQRAVELTETFAERQGFLSRVEEKLERAAVPIRPGEALFFLVGFVVLVAALVTAVTGAIIAGIIFGMIAAGIGGVSLDVLARRRLSKFEGQLPDTLQMLAGTLRAGYSLPQGIDAVSKEIDDPMGVELRRAMTEAQLGREIDDALGSVAERLNSPDFAWAVMALGIQREVGGNLNELLMTVADTMVQRERLKREVAALTAEGRVSAMILSLMPPGLGIVLYVMNPEYVGILFSRTLGLILIGLAVVSALVGLLWMRKVITIDA